MTVKELKILLSGYPDDATVAIEYHGQDWLEELELNGESRLNVVFNTVTLGGDHS